METDVKAVVDALHSLIEDNSEFGQFINECKWFLIRNHFTLQIETPIKLLMLWQIKLAISFDCLNNESCLEGMFPFFTIDESPIFT